MIQILVTGGLGYIGSHTAPLRAFYTAQNKFHSINGIGSIEEITARLMTAIDAL